MFSNVVQSTIISQGDIQTVQSKTILTLFKKNKENILHLLKERGKFIIHIKTKNIFSTTST